MSFLFRWIAQHFNCLELDDNQSNREITSLDKTVPDSYLVNSESG
jgi:hypothetical protein